MTVGMITLRMDDNEKVNEQSIAVVDAENLGLFFQKKADDEFEAVEFWIKRNHRVMLKEIYMGYTVDDRAKYRFHRWGWEFHDVVTKRNVEEDIRMIKNAADLKMAINVMEYLYEVRFQNLILMSGDGDFIPLVNKAKRMGKKVIIVSYKDALNPGLAYVADEVHFVDDLVKDLKGKPKVQPPRSVEPKVQPPKSVELKPEPMKREGIDPKTGDRIRNALIDAVKKGDGNFVSSGKGLQIVRDLTGTKNFEELGVKSTRDMFKSYPSVFRGFDARKNKWYFRR
jgi:uncharacterized LabA/DUF88 family protein